MDRGDREVGRRVRTDSTIGTRPAVTLVHVQIADAVRSDATLLHVCSDVRVVTETVCVPGAARALKRTDCYSGVGGRLAAHGCVRARIRSAFVDVHRADCACPSVQAVTLV